VLGPRGRPILRAFAVRSDYRCNMEQRFSQKWEVTCCISYLVDTGPEWAPFALRF
jgi:hypothetical protein